MNLIFSADDCWGIGKDGDLLVRSARDLQRFKELTTGKVVVMGSATLRSLPGGRGLPNRENLVLTRDRSAVFERAESCHSLDALLDRLGQYDSQDVFVIGGEAVYKLLLEHCDTAYITRFYTTKESDRDMPDFDALAGWSLRESSALMEENGIDFRFLTYKRD